MKRAKRAMFLLNSIKPIFFLHSSLLRGCAKLVDYGLSNAGETAVLVPLLGIVSQSLEYSSGTFM